MTETKLLSVSEPLLEKLKLTAKTMPCPCLYWDQSDRIDIKSICRALQSDTPLMAVYNEIYDLNIDAIYSLEVEHIADAMGTHEVEIRVENSLDQDEELDLNELARQYREEFFESFYVDLNIGQLLRGSVEVRVEMNSNNDCINSHWLESGSGYDMDGYFGDVVRQLGLIPAMVKKILTLNGVKTKGPWPNRSDKDKLISYEGFWQEIENRSCGACLLTFVGTIDIYTLLTNWPLNGRKLIIPKGNYVGFFSSCQGGGSTLEACLQRYITLDLSIPWGASREDSYRLVIDQDRDNGYSIEEAYGVTRSFWGTAIMLS